jgi:hypothetical protein
MTGASIDLAGLMNSRSAVELAELSAMLMDRAQQQAISEVVDSFKRLSPQATRVMIEGDYIVSIDGIGFDFTLIEQLNRDLSPETLHLVQRSVIGSQYPDDYDGVQLDLTTKNVSLRPVYAD